MRKILVTGGKGYLGQNIVSFLVEKGEQVKVFARPQGNNAGKISNEFEVVWGDIRDIDAVDKAVKGSDIVIHLVSNFRKGGSDRKEAYSINVEGTENVLKASLKRDVKRIVHCSTIGVHGNVLEIPAREDTPFNPGDLYQETKLIGEQKVWQFYQKTGLPVTVVRPISLMGPGDERMLKLFRMIKRGRFIMVGKGDAYFQPAYIDDVVRGFYLCMQHPAAVGEAFIIGSEEYITLKELVNIIAVELNVSSPKYSIPIKPLKLLAHLCEAICVPMGIEPPLHLRRVSFFENNRAFSIEKAKKVLGYHPQVSLREGIHRTACWYMENGWI